VRGFIDPNRFVVTCNGRRVPLQATAEPSTLIAGVRYRARMLRTSLHPTVPVHAPLVFELTDTFHQLSVGRCAYHVTAPNGQFYAGLPTEAAAAERRAERFVVLPPADSPARIPAVEVNPEFPGTLDLRIPPPGSKLK
jgi:uncharacterized protein (DUF2126 family)